MTEYGGTALVTFITGGANVSRLVVRVSYLGGVVEVARGSAQMFLNDVSEEIIDLVVSVIRSHDGLTVLHRTLQLLVTAVLRGVLLRPGSRTGFAASLGLTR